ncbi:MAG: DUF6557 family protein [Balneolaceae bacterium]
MKLNELISIAEWSDVQSDIFKFYPEQGKFILKDLLFFLSLERMNVVYTDMRIVVLEMDPEDVEEFDLTHEVIGRNGTLNKDFEGFEYLAQSDNPDFANSEADYPIHFAPWEKWLGMNIDEDSLKSYRVSQIVALCLFHMTLYGYDWSEIQEERDRFQQKLDSLKMDLSYREYHPHIRVESKIYFEKILSL